MSAPSDAESTSLSSQRSPDTEVTSNNLSREHFHHPVSPVYFTIAPSSLPLHHPVFQECPTITPPSFLLIPALPMIAPSSFPLNYPVSMERSTIVPPSFPLYDPAPYPDVHPSSYTFNHPFSPEYRAVAPPSFSLHRPVSPVHPTITSPSVSCFPWSWTQIPHRRQVTVDMLPGEALLEIFDWYLIGVTWDGKVEAWQTLVHVCQKWRNVVFESPHRLNLRLLCTDDSPVGKILDIWPALPIVIRNDNTEMGEDNIVAALTHNVRVCGIDIYCEYGSLWEKALVAMQEPFPALTHLDIYPNYEAPSIVSDSFLGGSAPNLRYLGLGLVPFPGLPKLLSSVTHLVKLGLWGIPHSGYFSPEAMATALSALTSLETITLEFESPRSCPGRGLRHPPPTTTRSVLPALTKFIFKGVSEYLEDLVARINAPILGQLQIENFAQLIFHTPLLAQFIGRTPNFKALDEAHVIFSIYGAILILPQTYGDLHLNVPYQEPDWQLSMLAQVCSSSLDLISSLEHLYIRESEDCLDIRLHWGVDIENIQWLELLRPFTTVKALYLSRHFTSRVIPALEELVGERATEVLPTLQSLFLEGLHLSRAVKKAIKTFVAARRLSGLPLTVSHWDRDRAKSR